MHIYGVSRSHTSHPCFHRIYWVLCDTIFLFLRVFLLEIFFSVYWKSWKSTGNSLVISCRYPLLAVAVMWVPLSLSAGIPSYLSLSGEFLCPCLQVSPPICRCHVPPCPCLQAPLPICYCQCVPLSVSTGIPSYLLINATALDFPGRISRLELLNLHGDTLVEIPIHYHASRPSLYNVSAFIPPPNFFYIKVRL